MFYIEYAIFLAVFFAGFGIAIGLLAVIRNRAMARLRDEYAPIKIFPNPGREAAAQAASDRRNYLESRLADNVFDVYYEIFEPVPGIEIKPRQLSRFDAAAQRAGLRWQLTDDPFLLIGRVMDALIAISRQHELPAERLAVNVRLTLGAKSRNDFQVVVETFLADFIAEQLDSLRSWLGIAILVQSPAEASDFGAGMCKIAGGRSGWAGGVIRFSIDQFLVTCTHVVFDGCKSLYHASELRSQTYQPDAALLSYSSPCFRFDQSRAKAIPISRQDAHILASGEKFRVPTRSRTGHIIAIVPWATYSGRTHHFPHAQIASDTYLIMDLFNWPPWSNDFSVVGDSGSWVVSASSRWLGMLVAGSARHHFSYVALGEPLVDFLSTCYSHKSGQARVDGVPCMEVVNA